MHLMQINTNDIALYTINENCSVNNNNHLQYFHSQIQM